MRPTDSAPAQPETLMMGHAQTTGHFTLDGSLVNAAPFEDVKRKGVQGGGRDAALEERRMKGLPLHGVQGKLTFRMLALILGGQAVILSFFALVARGNAIAAGRPEDGPRLLWVGLGLAVLALVTAGLMRRPYGITLGWIVQALTWASAVLVTAMIGVAIVFTALWVLLLIQGMKVDRLVAERELVGADEPATDVA